MFLFGPTPHTEASRFIADKPLLTRDAFAKLLPELRARAFTIAGVQSFDVMQSIRDRIAELPLGGERGNWDDIKKDIVPQLLPEFVDPDADAETRAAQAEAANRRAELLIRTHGQQAYASAAYKIADAQRDIFPFWMYQTLGDGRVRPSHAALNGIILPANDPFWKTHTPPWDWGCRCQFIPMTEEDAAQIREQDADKPYEQQRVLDDAARRLLNDANTIHRGSNLETGGGHPVPYNVAAPSQTGKANAYTWHPDEKALTLDDLRSRYDAPTFTAFEQWARATVIPEQGRTILEWLSGSTILPPDAKPTLPADTAAPKTFAELRPDLEKAAQRYAARANSLELQKQQAQAKGDWSRTLKINAVIEKLRATSRAKMHPLLFLPAAVRATVKIQTFAANDHHALGMKFVNSVAHKDAFGGAQVAVKRTRHRACADPYGVWIDGKAMAVRTVVHELGHIIEARNRALLKRSLAFRASRTPGETPKWLGAGYGKKEIALDDKFQARGGSSYSGKVYQHLGQDYASEILSMGIERLYTDPAGFLAKDPEYFAFIVDVLRNPTA